MSKSVLITGASSGIGLELARLFARDGYHLILTARASERLDAVAKELNAQTIPDDLADSAAPQRIVASLNGIVPDVLVNNAGFGIYGAFADLDPAVPVDMLQVNVVALTNLTRLLLPGMIARSSGRILNVASTAAFQPGPYMAVYYASKAYVLSFSEALNYELRKSGITCTALCPGPTTTEFQKRAGVQNSPLFDKNTMTAQAVARLGYDAMLRGKAVAIAGTKNRLLAFATRFAPRSMVTAVAGRLNSGR